MPMTRDIFFTYALYCLTSIDVSTWRIEGLKPPLGARGVLDPILTRLHLASIASGGTLVVVLLSDLLPLVKGHESSAYAEDKP